jgi:hypothetical protein
LRPRRFSRFLARAGRRKEAYQALHPETRHGGERASRKLCDLKDDRFTADTAAKTGRSERDVQLDAQRGKNIPEAVLMDIAGAPRMPEEDGDEPTFIVVTGGLPGIEPQRVIVDGVEVIRRPGGEFPSWGLSLRNPGPDAARRRDQGQGGRPKESPGGTDPGAKKPPAILSQGAKLRISDNFADCMIRTAMVRACWGGVKGLPDTGKAP